jgi:hypothetical protein
LTTTGTEGGADYAATESRQFSNIAATTLQFPVAGGKYSFDALGTWGSGNAQVQLLGGDASTWLNVGSAVTANGVQTLDLPAGQYRIAISSGATAVYAALTKIAED